MIIDQPHFISENRLADLPAGGYIVVESVYARIRDALPAVVLSELLCAATHCTIGADLLFTDADGVQWLRDFCVAADGSWRDSYGARAGSLADLLPSELQPFVLMSRRGITVHHDGNGHLIRTSLEAKNHGA